MQPNEPAAAIDREATLRDILCGPGMPNERFNSVRIRGLNEPPFGYPDGACGRCGALPGEFHRAASFVPRLSGSKRRARFSCG